MTGTEDEGHHQRQQITAVVMKILGVAVAVGLVIGIGAWVLVKALGLDSSQTGTSGPADVQPVTPLPTTALPVPSDSASPSGSAGSTTASPVSGDLNLTAAPALVKPNERINLTGQWPGHDNESLLVQRFDSGQWVDFAGVRARVNVGTFATYVMTGRVGDQKFRVFDPATQTASNDVTVTVGG